MGVFYSLPNGTSGTKLLYASEVIITTEDNASCGQYVGTGASWSGTPDQYKITINAPEHGISGTFLLRNPAPAHYPCGPAIAKQNMMVAPEIGWSNIIPDAEGIVNFTILDSKLEFEGIAYHDKVLPLPFMSHHPYIKTLLRFIP